MPLLSELSLNGRRLGHIYVHRIRPDSAQPRANTVCEYEWHLVVGPHAATGAVDKRGRVKHRYGDGSWALIARVIEAARQDGS